MNYSKMSDKEISVEISRRIAKKRLSDTATQIEVTAPIHSLFANYCNSWADMGPLIENARVTLRPCSDELADGEGYRFSGLWACSATNSDGYTFSSDANCLVHLHENPLRAAAIVWLMADDEKNGVIE